MCEYSWRAIFGGVWIQSYCCRRFLTCNPWGKGAWKKARRRSMKEVQLVFNIMKASLAPERLPWNKLNCTYLLFLWKRQKPRKGAATVYYFCLFFCFTCKTTWFWSIFFIIPQEVSFICTLTWVFGGYSSVCFTVYIFAAQLTNYLRYKNFEKTFSREFELEQTVLTNNLSKTKFKNFGNYLDVFTALLSGGNRRPNHTVIVYQ